MTRLYDLMFPRETSLAWKLCTTAAVFTGSFLLTRAFLKFLRRRKYSGNLPPGLPSVPLLGSIPFLPDVDDMHKFFIQKAQELGPVFTMNLPNGLVVVINGREVIYEAFVKQSLAFANRPFSFSASKMNPEFKGIISHPYDSDFRRYHQLSLNILKKLGFGRGIMENRILVEVEDLLENLRKLNGVAICADQLLTKSVSNVIISIIFGERYDYSSPMLTQLIETSHELVALCKDLFAVDAFPKLRFLPKYRKCLNGCIRTHDEILGHLSSKIDAGLQGKLQESFITHFLEMEGPEFDRDQLLFTLDDLFAAGTETTATTLQWAFIFLANHPDVQQRCRSEIDSVVSRDRLPSLDDRKKLPFTEAVILELLRIKTVVPLGLLRETLQDVHLNGCFIAKGSMILANLYGVHMDPTVWKEPETFNPRRFLDADGNVVKRDTVMPFSLGRRSCLGELLAQQEIFLFIAGLVQHFDIQPPDGQSTVVYKELVSVTLAPAEYEVRLLPRGN